MISDLLDVIDNLDLRDTADARQELQELQDLHTRIALLEALADAVATYVDEDGKGWTPGNYQALKAALAALESAA